MIDRLSPYSAYRDSGTHWAGRVPEHWTTIRCRYLLREVDERSSTGAETHLSMTQTAGLVAREQITERRLLSESYVGGKLCMPGDLVLNRLKAHLGVFALVPQPGLVSPDYTVLRCTSSAVNMRFLELLLRSAACRSELRARVKGLVEGFWRLYTDDLYDIKVALPSLLEQQAIVRFLGHADRRIRRYIRAKQKLIKRLEERKQAIVYSAVTRGLDADARIIPSGVRWLEDRPAHWELVPNRAYLRIRKVLVGERHPDFQLLSLTKRGIIIRDVSENKGKFSSDMGTSQEVRRGDLVFCLFDVPETPRTVGLSAYDGMITGAYTVMECSDPSVARFVEAFYVAMDDRKLLSPLYSGLRNTIPKSRFLSARMPMPAPEEREAILRYLERETDSLDKGVERATREVALLREFLSRVTADVVTGKLDVRAAAALLPDESTELTAADEETLVEADDEEEVELDAALAEE